ncbi:aspartyl-phosphate phosphatase Spo0E family protein [uncultured Brevibacillus sp.]|uniref:aspartyl-phosphate phosphatase Spo0E family protein n=1 Tax=uncultured Brevibacillus sp. TaxID=169970 RepID=UPI002593CD54|nr:aspartyl-phosphate phosphatase Spo0E family protein [uncultured Brevibacillus sp.]
MMLSKIERARQELYQAVTMTSGAHGMSEPYVLKKSRKLDNLIYRYLLSEKTRKSESERKGRGP